jgi:hypothetical protein
VHIPANMESAVAAGRLEFVAGILAVVAGNAFFDIDMIAGFVVAVEWVVGALNREEERRHLALERKLVLVPLRSELFRFRLGRPF